MTAKYDESINDLRQNQDSTKSMQQLYTFGILALKSHGPARPYGGVPLMPIREK
jgi:hypothetical protein